MGAVEGLTIGMWFHVKPFPCLGFSLTRFSPVFVFPQGLFPFLTSVSVSIGTAVKLILMRCNPFHSLVLDYLHFDHKYNTSYVSHTMEKF